MQPLTCSAVRMLAPWAADDPVGRAERPRYTIRQAREHPQRAAARRAALPASLRCTAQQTGAQHSTSNSTHRRARSRSNADARVDPTRTHAQHARLARQRSSTHMSTLPTINSRPATIRTMRTVSRRLCSLTHARFSHRHRRHALPLHTCSNTTPPKHSPAQNGQGPPLGDPGSLWIVTALGSSAAISRSRHDSTPTASFEVRLVDLLWPQPPLT